MFPPCPPGLGATDEIPPHSLFLVSLLSCRTHFVLQDHKTVHMVHFAQAVPSPNVLALVSCQVKKLLRPEV